VRKELWSLVSPTKKENDSLLVTKGVSNDEIFKLEYHSEILAKCIKITKSFFIINKGPLLMHY
jgi:hypothetical protein